MEIEREVSKSMNADLMDKPAVEFLEINLPRWEYNMKWMRRGR